MSSPDTPERANYWLRECDERLSRAIETGEREGVDANMIHELKELQIRLVLARQAVEGQLRTKGGTP